MEWSSTILFFRIPHILKNGNQLNKNLWVGQANIPRLFANGSQCWKITDVGLGKLNSYPWLSSSPRVTNDSFKYESRNALVGDRQILQTMQLTKWKEFTKSRNLTFGPDLNYFLTLSFIVLRKGLISLLLI